MELYEIHREILRKHIDTNKYRFYMDYVETSGNTCKDIGITHGIYAYIHIYRERERGMYRAYTKYLGRIQKRIGIILDI